ncbi:hypothetical protein GCM10008938_02270 [Deinococcus roseus]|uniref:Uncharacterized protein n=1 Tax=Deinococcus roseus TaxID=392414 RepID=A0ABQ2CTM0_9DEIO|nr:hypothetical protein GCM10008938_02270 [Deinococcus roseus]
MLVETDPLDLLLVHLEQQWTIKEAAEQLGWSLLKTYRQVQRLLDLGLLVVSQHIPRKGRAIKKYTAACECFFVPYHLTPMGALEQLLDVLEQDARRMLFTSTARVFEAESVRTQHEVGLHLFRNRHGQPSVIHSLCAENQPPRGIVRNLLDQEATALWNEWASLRLNHDDAKALQQRLASLVREFSEKQGSGRYLMRVALVPVEDASP